VERQDGRCPQYYGGSISAAAITFGTNYINNDWCWRIPLIGQALPALVVIGALFVMPESPRWLMQNSRKDEALAFLVKYREGVVQPWLMICRWKQGSRLCRRCPRVARV
jgi:hypothetical protein